jgi:hypothetical protein
VVDNALVLREQAGGSAADAERGGLVAELLERHRVLDEDADAQEPFVADDGGDGPAVPGDDRVLLGEPCAVDDVAEVPPGLFDADFFHTLNPTGTVGL